MNLLLHQLGPIHELSLDLSKRLLVFCGPNNTGKTYASYSLYGLHALVERPGALVDDFPLPFDVSTLMQSGAMQFSLHQYWSYNQSVLEGAIAQRLKERLPDVFASTPAHFEKATLKIDLSHANTEAHWEDYQFQEKLPLGQAFQLELLKAKNTADVKVLLIATSHGHSANQPNQNPDGSLVAAQLRAWLCTWLLSTILPTPHLIPAERIAIQLFAREMALVRSRSLDVGINHSGKRNLKQKGTADRTQLYPLAIRDALQWAEDATVIKRQKSSVAPLANWLEQTVLGGKITVNKEGELDYTPNNQKKAMPLHTAASMVKSLAGLVLYLRHLAHPNDLLILDEPELNLHPNNQVQLARLIARMIASGIKVLMTTHSDYLIRELNIMMSLASFTKGRSELMKKYGYENQDLLPHQSVGAYMFGGGDGAYPEPLFVGPDGFAVVTIDVVTGQQNIASDEINYYLARELYPE